ncbi:MAG: hypothetical protein IJH07_09155 [Ruminococcus sp.]|nr:hypothetical protein [Ruminococcus sp.]
MILTYTLTAIGGLILAALIVWFFKRNLRDLIDVLFGGLEEQNEKEKAD